MDLAGLSRSDPAMQYGLFRPKAPRHAKPCARPAPRCKGLLRQSHVSGSQLQGHRPAAQVADLLMAAAAVIAHSQDGPGLCNINEVREGLGAYRRLSTSVGTCQAPSHNSVN